VSLLFCIASERPEATLQSPHPIPNSVVAPVFFPFSQPKLSLPLCPPVPSFFYGRCFFFSTLFMGRQIFVTPDHGPSRFVLRLSSPFVFPREPRFEVAAVTSTAWPGYGSWLVSCHPLVDIATPCEAGAAVYLRTSAIPSQIIWLLI